MGLSTTDLAKEGGSGLPKTIAPGDNTLKINRIELEPFKFIDGAKRIAVAGIMLTIYDSFLTSSSDV